MQLAMLAKAIMCADTAVHLAVTRCLLTTLIGVPVGWIASVTVRQIDSVTVDIVTKDRSTVDRLTVGQIGH